MQTHASHRPTAGTPAHRGVSARTCARRAACPSRGCAAPVGLTWTSQPVFASRPSEPNGFNRSVPPVSFNRTAQPVGANRAVQSEGLLPETHRRVDHQQRWGSGWWHGGRLSPRAGRFESQRAQVSSRSAKDGFLKTARVFTSGERGEIEGDVTGPREAQRGLVFLGDDDFLEGRMGEAIGVAAGCLLSGPALAEGVSETQQLVHNPAVGEVSAVLEAGVLLLYLGGLLSLLAFGTFLVVRQVLVRRELENAAKELQERVRSGQASSEEYFELGAVMLRKKFYTLANKYLLQAVAKWEGDEQELAKVHNALGFSYFSEEQWDKAITEYQKALKLQPAYGTAWNNLGDSLEKKKDWAKALKAYESCLMYDPSNKVANERRQDLQRKVEQLTF